MTTTPYTTLLKPRRLAATAMLALLLMATLVVYGRVSSPGAAAAHMAVRPALPAIICAPPQDQGLPSLPLHPH
jgi:hypothetical protein